MQVYVWLPKNHTKGVLNQNSGHAAIDIAGRYFSFSGDDLNKKFVGERQWVECLKDDEEYHRKHKNKRSDFQLNVPKKLEPYILDVFNPKNGYPGLASYRYDLFKNNCSTVVAILIRVAVVAYLFELFSDENDISYWKNQENEKSLRARLDKLKSYYPSHVEKNIFNFLTKRSDRQAILTDWTLSNFYLMSYLDIYELSGVNTITNATNFFKEKYDEVFWHPFRVMLYALFAQKLIETMPNHVVRVPRVYRLGWDISGDIKRREVQAVEEFELILPSQTTVRNNIDVAFLGRI